VLAALYSSVKKYLYDDCSVWCMHDVGSAGGTVQQR